MPSLVLRRQQQEQRDSKKTASVASKMTMVVAPSTTAAAAVVASSDRSGSSEGHHHHQVPQHVTPQTSPCTSAKFPPLVSLDQQHQNQIQYLCCSCSSPSSPPDKSMAREGTLSSSSAANFAFDCNKLDSIGGAASPLHPPHGGERSASIARKNKSDGADCAVASASVRPAHEQVHQESREGEGEQTKCSSFSDCVETSSSKIQKDSSNTTSTNNNNNNNNCNNRKRANDKMSRKARDLDIDPLSGTIVVGCSSLVTPTSVEVQLNSSSSSCDSSPSTSEVRSRGSSDKVRPSLDEQDQAAATTTTTRTTPTTATVTMTAGTTMNNHHFIVSTPPTTTTAATTATTAAPGANNHGPLFPAQEHHFGQSSQIKQPSACASIARSAPLPRPPQLAPIPLHKVSYADIENAVTATIVDQTVIHSIRTAPASEFTYRSELQRGTVVLGTARTLSGQVFTVQRLMVGQLERGFLHQLGFHALGRLLSFVSGDDVLIFGYPMECPKKVERLLAPPAMLGFWLPVQGLNVRLVDLQRMRVMFAEEGILCAADPEEQAQLLEEAERRRQQHSILSPNAHQKEEEAAIWGTNNNNNNSNTIINNNNNKISVLPSSAAPSESLSSFTASFIGLPESPVSMEPARSPPGGSEAITVQLPVILYRAPRPHHPVPAMNVLPPRGFKPFVDTTHRKNQDVQHNHMHQKQQRTNNYNHREFQGCNSDVNNNYRFPPASIPCFRQQQQQQQEPPCEQHVQYFTNHVGIQHRLQQPRDNINNNNYNNFSNYYNYQYQLPQQQYQQQQQQRPRNHQVGAIGAPYMN